MTTPDPNAETVVALVPTAPPSKVASINPAELWGAAGALTIAGTLWTTGIPSQMGLSPELTALLCLGVFALMAIVRATFQAWSSGKRGHELATVAKATAQAAVGPEMLSALKTVVQTTLIEHAKRTAIAGSATPLELSVEPVSKPPA